jgi:hypothetical protein
MGSFRKLFLGLACITVLVLLLAAAAQLYLGSGHATAQVVQNLENAFGAPVHAEQANIGLTSSELRGLQLFEPDSGPDAQPWVSVQTLEADVSTWSLLRGTAMPNQVTLTGAAVTLRLDREGRLLTRLPPAGEGPATISSVRIRDASLTLKQQGKPPAEFHGIDAELQPAEGRIELMGNISDPCWGDWSVTGLADAETWAGKATLKTPLITAATGPSPAGWTCRRRRCACRASPRNDSAAGWTTIAEC